MWWPFKRKAPRPPLEDQLAEAKAELARMRKMPEEDFTLRNRDFPYMIVEHGIDAKPKELARQRAYVAYLKSKVESKYKAPKAAQEK